MEEKKMVDRYLATKSGDFVTMVSGPHADVADSVVVKLVKAGKEVLVFKSVAVVKMGPSWDNNPTGAANASVDSSRRVEGSDMKIWFLNTGGDGRLLTYAEASRFAKEAVRDGASSVKVLRIERSCRQGVAWEWCQ